MNKRRLGTSDIEVTSICLGTMNWGEQNTEADAHEQMDYAVAHGVNFFDTAEIYPIPPREQSHHLTETYIGNWLKKTNKRNDLVIATKVAGRNDTNMYLRPTGKKLAYDKKNIEYAIEGSLKRLQTDYVDLYQLHWPERTTNFFGKRGYVHNAEETWTPIEETLEALQGVVKSGKVRYIGVSNETAWGVTEFLRIARAKGLPVIQSIQNPYSLIMREFEYSMAEIIMRENVSMLVYSPLAMGVLTGKYIAGALPKGSRFDYSPRNIARYNAPQAQPAIEAYVSLARQNGLDPAQMAIAYVISREFVTSTIIGATSLEQLRADIGAHELTLPHDVIAQIEEIHARMPDPIA